MIGAFGEKVFDIIEAEPRLREVDGIGGFTRPAHHHCLGGTNDYS
jgi:hypothetical protein